MARKDRNKVFWIIRNKIQCKHPTWPSRQVFAVTTKLYKKNTK